MAKKFNKLTRVAIRKLEPGQKVNEHGITFERMANGDGRYLVNIMIDGQRVHRVVGRESEGVTRQQAEDFIEKARTEAREGRLNLPKGRKVPLSIQEASEQYLSRLAQEGGRELKKKRERLTLHVFPALGMIPLALLTTADVDRYKMVRQKEGARPATINRELTVLSHILTKAAEWEWIDVCRARVRRLKENNGRITYLTREQAAHLLAAAKADQNPQIWLFVLMGLETAMRHSEILSVRLEHIDLDRRLIYIPHAKAGPREQPITAHLAGILRQELAQAQAGRVWLYPSEVSASGRRPYLTNAFKRVVKAAGLDPRQVTPHVLRHTAITHLVQEGVDLPTVQRISGHKNLTMVVRYSHQSGEHIREAMDRLERRYIPSPVTA